jgi:putative colanic acid biosysnthesis UDP-glucose lipid carrier transferase
MNSRYTNLFRIFFSFLDICVLNIIHLLLIIIIKTDLSANVYNYLLLFVLMNVAWLACAYVTALYINDTQLNFERFAKRTMQAFLLFILVILSFIFLYKYSFSRLFVVSVFCVFGSTLILSRALFIWGTEYFMNNGLLTKKVVILGYNEVSQKLVSHFISKAKNISIKGYFEDYRKVNELSVFPIIGSFQECVPYAISNEVSEIYCTIAPETHSFIYEIAQDAERNFIRFKFVPDLRLFVNRTIHFNYVEDIPILSLRSEPLQDVAGRIKKRIFDILFSFFIITFVLSWLVPLIAILTKLVSRGPVFFVQLRSGKNNRSFRCYKFRSLEVNKEADSKQVTRDDTRFTKLGKFIRKTNIDELPQFVNVLLGDMSIAGPRPHMLKHTEIYSELLSQYMVRHYVKPGITGWAQVNGYRGETQTVLQMANRVEHDIWYMENWSLWLDIKIVYMTIINTIRGEKNAC